MISYEPFWNTLKKKNITTYYLIKKEVVAASTIQRMRNNLSLTLASINDICNFLECDISDVVKIVPDSMVKEEKNNIEKVKNEEKDQI